MKYRIRVLLTVACLFLCGCAFNLMLQYQAVLTTERKQLSFKSTMEKGHAATEQPAPLEPTREICKLGFRMDSAVPVGCPGDVIYNKCIKVFNTALVGLRPSVVVRPRNEEDVKLALVHAAYAGLQVTVKNGGHNPAGQALNDKGMVIDMMDMGSVKWGGDSGLDIVSGGGATWEQVHSVLKDKTRTIVGGGCPQVGVAGLALGGGVGWISRSKGLVSDNVLSYSIVFPNGTSAMIDDERNSELMWALRGAGGSNFGVVTEVRMRTFPAEEKYFAGAFCYEKEANDMRSTLELVQSVVNEELDLDDRLTMDMFMSRHPQTIHDPYTNGPRVRFCWGAMFDGPIFEALASCKVLLDKIAELPSEDEVCMKIPSPCQSEATTKDAVDKMRAFVRRGGPWLQNHSFRTWSSAFGAPHLDVFWKSTTADRFTDEMLDETIRHFSDVPDLLDDYGSTPTLQIAFEHLGGAMSRNAGKISAWKHGKAKYMGSIQSYLPHPFSFVARGSDKHNNLLHYLKNWTDSYYNGLSRHSQGSYGNYADAELNDWADKYYGPEVYNRLRSVKRQIEGNKIFSTNQRIDVGEKLDTPNNSVDSMTEAAHTDKTILDSVIPRMNASVLEHAASKICPRVLVETMVPILRSQINSSEIEDGVHEVNPASPNKKSSVGPDKIKINRTVLLTGGSRGIGWSTALHLANLGMSVVYTSQTENGCRDSLRKMEVITFRFGFAGTVSCVPLALDDFESVRSFLERTGQVLFDVIILNAGNFLEFSVSEKAGNVSNSLAVNHLGHFLLVHELLESKSIQEESGLVVVVSSFAILGANLEHIEDALKVPAVPYSGLNSSTSSSVYKSGRFFSYAAVKTINYMFASELARRLKQSGSNISVGVVAPPGTAATHLISEFLEIPEKSKEILHGNNPITPAEAALGIVYLASGLAPRDKASDRTGFNGGCGSFTSDLPAVTNDQDLSCKIWDTSLKITNLIETTSLNPLIQAFIASCNQVQ